MIMENGARLEGLVLQFFVSYKNLIARRKKKHHDMTEAFIQQGES